MKYVLFFILTIFLLPGRGAKEMDTVDYNLLNGIWEGDCSMMTTGEFKGEIECPVMETQSSTTILLNERFEGVWIAQRGDNPPDTTKTKLIMRNKQAILRMERNGKQEERQIFSVTKDSLKVYTSDKEYLALFRRKK